MEAARATPLQLVSETSGEYLDFDALRAEVQGLQDKLKGAERDLNGWRVRYQELKRDREKDARADALWPQGTELFRLYCRLTGKEGKPRKLTWSAERFELVRPLLAKHGTELCVRAIVGRVADHFTSQRANGSTIHYHEWERIFGSKGQGQTCASNYEESANRAPTDWKARAEAAGFVFSENGSGVEKAENESADG